MSGTVRRAASGAEGDALRTALVALASELGRPPTAVETRSVMSSLGVRRADVDSLADRLRDTPSTGATTHSAWSQREHRTGNTGPSTVPAQLPVVAASAPAGTLDEGGWDDGGDPFAVPPESAPHSWAVSDPTVTVAFADLIDDVHRAGGLDRADLDRLIVRRRLDGAQTGELLGLLHERGLEATDRTLVGDGGEDEAERPGAGLDLVRTYLLEIGRHKLIYADDEVRLGMAIRTGLLARAELEERWPQHIPRENLLAAVVAAGRRAHDTLVQANLRLVVSIAKLRRYEWSGVEFLDRVQDGNLGLMHAADKFDATMGYKFSTYATWWIRQHIERGIADRGRLIRLPAHMHDKVRRVRATRRRLTEELGREPTLFELSNAVDIEPGTLQAVLDWSRPVISLDHEIGPDGDVTLGDLLADRADIDGRHDPADAVERAWMVRDVHEHIEHASGGERNAAIIRARYGLGSDGETSTLEEIGRGLGLTRERIRQLEARTLGLLRTSPNAARLREYVPQRNSTAPTSTVSKEGA